MSFCYKPCKLLGMQNQSTSGQNSLQQTGGSLQQNSSNLQQSGTPATSSDVFTVLSQNTPSNGLTVQSAQTDPSIPPQTYSPDVSLATWLMPVVFVILAAIAFVAWLKVRSQILDVSQEVADQAEPIVEEKVNKPASKTKTGKKTTRRKRQNKR